MTLKEKFFQKPVLWSSVLFPIICVVSIFAFYLLLLTPSSFLSEKLCGTIEYGGMGEDRREISGILDCHTRGGGGDFIVYITIIISMLIIWGTIIGFVIEKYHSKKETPTKKPSSKIMPGIKDQKFILIILVIFLLTIFMREKEVKNLSERVENIEIQTSSLSSSNNRENSELKMDLQRLQKALIPKPTLIPSQDNELPVTIEGFTKPNYLVYEFINREDDKNCITPTMYRSKKAHEAADTGYFSWKNIILGKGMINHVFVISIPKRFQNTEECLPLEYISESIQLKIK